MAPAAAWGAFAFHVHLCPGQVLGVRITVAGCRALSFPHPQQAGKRLVVFVEIDRCATRRHRGAHTGAAVRVAAREEARELARALVPEESALRRAQTVAYRTLDEVSLLALAPVAVDPAWLRRQRRRVRRASCGEGVNYEREIRVGGRTLCRACAGDCYYTLLAGGPARL